MSREVDQIYHMACPASPVHYQYNAIKTIKTNVLGLKKIFFAKIIPSITSTI